MKIFAAGISTESNTFSPVPTGLKDFQVIRGRDNLADRADYPNLDLSSTWGRSARDLGHEFVFSLMAFAQPSGVTVRPAYEQLRDEFLADLKAELPVDIVLLSLHGAMVAEGYDDCEGDMIRRVREVAGSDAVIGALFDLHCHFSPAKIADADIVITYKEYPHTDVNARSSELFDLAIATKHGEIRPVMALFDCRMIAPYPTSQDPMREFVDAMTAAERRDGVLSLSLGHGFQYADLPHVGAKMLAVTDGDAALAKNLAEEFGAKVHTLRGEIGFDSISLPMEEALPKAVTSSRTPVVLADQSDNPGAGAPGDSTFALRWLLERGASDVAMGIFYDPEVVKIAKRVGAGATIRVRFGGKLGPTSGDPIDLEATVLATRDDYSHALVQDAGPPWLFSAGDIAAIRTGGIDIVVSSERCQCLNPEVFRDLGIEPSERKLVVVKSSQHFYGTFAPLAAEVIYMAAPGAASPDPKVISYERLDISNMYPWVKAPVLDEAIVL